MDAAPAANNGILYLGVRNAHARQHAGMGIDGIFGIMKFKRRIRRGHVHTNIEVGADRTDVFPETAEHMRVYPECLQRIG
ncbi:MAG: hypothetical protein BWX80_02846 [Candidatus Hydrogenedentes bacterium ADurb.Bin101]|nr:MAG: hypothetical protein BWX80_02846 [Candidatus Hydrogenedentes bacterium ADurb.Bin101]